VRRHAAELAQASRSSPSPTSSAIRRCTLVMYARRGRDVPTRAVQARGGARLPSQSSATPRRASAPRAPQRGRRDQRERAAGRRHAARARRRGARGSSHGRRPPAPSGMRLVDIRGRGSSQGPAHDARSPGHPARHRLPVATRSPHRRWLSSGGWRSPARQPRMSASRQQREQAPRDQLRGARNARRPSRGTTTWAQQQVRREPSDGC
jgi:hypothetical protein